MFWLAIAFYGLASLVNKQTTVFSPLITVLVGIACGPGLRYLLGSMSERPSALDIAEALGDCRHAGRQHAPDHRRQHRDPQVRRAMR